MGGYHGRYLRIDVTHGTATWLALPETILRQFIGGVGLGTWLLYREAPAGVDALAAAAPLIFAFSPLVGTPLTTSAKFAVVAKSPLTFRLNDALSSSHFALAGKRTGADALVIVGARTTPSVLIVEDGRVRLEPAGELWGMNTDEAAACLTDRFGPDFHAAVIGPAGENRVRYATISHGNRHAGRGGLGAVMGSKRLKAVLVAGSQRVAVADPPAVVAAARDLSQRSFGPATLKYRELGTVANLLTFNRLHALPTRNFQQGSFESADALSGEGLNEARRIARASCAACTIGCEHIYALSAQTPPLLRGGKFPNLPMGASPIGKLGNLPPHKIGVSEEPGVRLEYESLFALGPLCGISDLDIVLRAARMCDQLGLDTISAGATVGFAMECAERGLLPAEGLRFGNGAALLDLLPRIASREGALADLLADGTRLAAATIGGEAPHFAPHVKGLEIPGYEPRTLQTMALGFAVGSRGADHNRSGAYEADFSPHADRLHGSPEAVLLAIDTEDRAALIDSLILCKFLRGIFADLFAESASLLHHVTGWQITAEELRTAARRIVTMKKLFNIREGWSKDEDTLPGRFLDEGLSLGANREASLPAERLQQMVQAYYAQRGWNRDGLVPAALLCALGLEEFANGAPPL